MNIAEILLTWC